MMRLVKQLAGIQDGGTAASPSFITVSPASNAGSSKNSQIVSKMGGDVVVECTGPIPVEFEIHPKYAGNKKFPAVCTETTFRGVYSTQTMLAMPVATCSKASGTSKCSAPPGTPRNQSKANIISNTPEREKHAMRPIADLPGATRYHQGRCSVCKARFNGRAPKVNKYCVPCSDISKGKLVCVCSRKRGAAETDDSCYSYHTRHPLDFIYTQPDFLDPDREQ